MLDSDWSRKFLLRSDWSVPKGATITTSTVLPCVNVIMGCNAHLLTGPTSPVSPQLPPLSRLGFLATLLDALLLLSWSLEKDKVG